MDMLDRNYTFAGGYDATSVAVTYATSDATFVGIVVLNFAATVSRNVTRQIGLGPNAAMTVTAGQMAGSGQLAHATAPSADMINFVSKFSDVCRLSENVIRLSGSAGCVADGNTIAGNAINMEMGKVLLSSIAVGASQDNPFTVMSGSFEFSECKLG